MDSNQNKNIDQIVQEVVSQFRADQAQAGIGSETSTVQNQSSSKALPPNVRLLRNKTLLWAVTAIIMCATMAYLGVAWYTRITTTHAVTFEVADYELAINDNTDNEFIVNVYSYQHVKGKLAAPGTSGYIPLKLSARHSEVDVDYSVVLKNMMLPDLQDHIRFFYLVGKKTADSTVEIPLVCELVDGKAADGTYEIVADHKSYFLQDINDLSKVEAKAEDGSVLIVEKKYIPARKFNEAGQMLEPTDAELEDMTIEGTLNLKKEKLIFLYWEWFLDADDAVSHGGITAAEKTEIITKSRNDANYEYYDAAFDDVFVSQQIWSDAQVWAEYIAKKVAETADLEDGAEGKYDVNSEVDQKAEIIADCRTNTASKYYDAKYSQMTTAPYKMSDEEVWDAYCAEQKKNDPSFNQAGYTKEQIEEIVNKCRTEEETSYYKEAYAQRITYLVSDQEVWQNYVDAWDAIDTDIGRYPTKYADSMVVHIICSGAQSEPVLRVETEAVTTTAAQPTE